VIKKLPLTNNADLSFLVGETVRMASNTLSWEALSWTLDSSFEIYQQCLASQRIELLWSGPVPVAQIPARRIDQALYDLIATAKNEILLVTFAASKIQRLVNELVNARHRGVKIRLILEFEQSSEGQLSYDALKAFPESFVQNTEVYCWPLEKRERNPAGRPGKLHAKLAIVDDTVLISSANLTDDAFNRNLEVGVMVQNNEFLINTKSYIGSMISCGILSRLTTMVSEIQAPSPTE
jgi:phosphatidylserine/phosphatidylglycerophosphate/cardiolipin synthase-like enzyme